MASFLLDVSVSDVERRIVGDNDRLLVDIVLEFSTAEISPILSTFPGFRGGGRGQGLCGALERGVPSGCRVEYETDAPYE